MPGVKEIYEYINSFAAFSTQESWDNSGLLLGDPDKQVTAVAFALDATLDTVREAEKLGAQLLVTHHPVIFSPAKRILAGSVQYEALTRGISVISAHTCWDSAKGGVNDFLAERLGFTEPEAIPLESTDTPLVRLCSVDPMNGETLARLVADKLGCHLRLADAGKEIRTVALCGGAGSSVLYELIGKADALITGELSHHHFIDAVENGLTVIAAGHFETEAPSMQALAEKIKAQFRGIEATVINQKNPVVYF